MKEDGHDRTASDEDSLLEVGQISGDRASSLCLNLLAVVVVPVGGARKSEGHGLHLDGLLHLGWGCDLGSDENGVSKHELAVHGGEGCIIRELEPHWAHEGLTSLRGGVEGRVEVVDDVVPSVDSVSDGILHTLGLDPGLSIDTVDVAVSSEEGEVTTSLVHSDPHLFRWSSNEAWNVGTAKDSAANTVLNDHLNCTEDLNVLCVVVSSPVSAELLRAKEERAGEHERSQVVVVTSKKATVALSLLGGTISVVELTVLNFFAVGADVFGSRWQSLALFREDAWLVHVIPSVVNLRRSNKLVIGVETGPVLLSVLVEEVNPDSVARPARALEVCLAT